MDRHQYSAGQARASRRRGDGNLGLSQVYRGRGRSSLRDIMDRDHDDMHGGVPFRWLVSTCLAGLVGAVAILVVIHGSNKDSETGDGLMPALKRLQEGTVIPAALPRPVFESDGLNWSVPKTDRLVISKGTTSTRYIIHETVKQKRDGRVYIHAKPYLRVVARLAPVPNDYADVIPPFNPFKLYSDSNPVGSTVAVSDDDTDSEHVKVKVIELLGRVLPRDDGQELDESEVQDIIEKAQVEESFAAGISQLSDAIGGIDPLAGASGEGLLDSDLLPQNTTVIPKSEFAADAQSDDLEGAKKVIVSVGESDTLAALLVRNGALKWQAEAMVKSARDLTGDVAIGFGDEVHITLVNSPDRENQFEPSRFSVFSLGHLHKVSVTRDDAGEYVASKRAITPNRGGTIVLNDSENGSSSTLYASIYHACLLQHVPPETIMNLLKVHAYTADFRRRVSAGDTLEMFFDFSEKDMENGAPGTLLMAQVTSRGETSRFYRYRTRDGEVDFYDDKGDNSKRFLMRKPVRGSNVRLTSGYGMRYHPLLSRRRMHTGVDWAAKPGTPVLAAGRGEIVYAGRKGQYGNYVRIKHANSYSTTYAHMRRFGRGVKVGVKVRQGQVIGYVGTTGLSTGPHLHFEVLVNKSFVNPTKLKVARERQLKDRDLLEFRKEKARVDNLISRAPVMTANK